MNHQPTRLALYGENGHQIHHLLARYPQAQLTAVADFPPDKLPPELRASIRQYATLDDLLAAADVDAVSLCSAKRSEQAGHAIRALRAGKHVFAEKPCALTEPDLDAIISAARETGCVFREMGAGVFDQPYFAMQQVVRSGRLGDIVQVIAEKSYPYYEGRPQNEDVDGGLAGQCALYCFRFTEHIAGVKVRSIQAVDTTLGNPVAGGGLRMAVALTARLANGGIASLSANYLNQRGVNIWGYETLRILGRRGWVESTQGGQHTRLVIGDEDCGPLNTGSVAPDLFANFLQDIANRHPDADRLPDDLSPTRWAIRARECLRK
ncbi:MAG: Gfo/Idh/MocA family oxidoreductase [Verrucomicrobiales bacterium]|jgi:predicted dehydrogenase|nr:Gfo/Idh/MocA family oxidoreductase [Verrucomicrobiales bacterium]